MHSPYQANGGCGTSHWISITQNLIGPSHHCRNTAMCPAKVSGAHSRTGSNGWRDYGAAAAAAAAAALSNSFSWAVASGTSMWRKRGLSFKVQLQHFVPAIKKRSTSPSTIAKIARRSGVHTMIPKASSLPAETKTKKTSIIIPNNRCSRDQCQVRHERAEARESNLRRSPL
jgi:hypothetical protein